MVCPIKFYDELTNAGVNYFTGVPDSLLKTFCAFVSDNVSHERHVIASNEGAAMGLAMGYHLATGEVPLVYMQNSGLGDFDKAGKFVTNKKYSAIQKELLKNAEYLENGTLKKLNLDKWDVDTANDFGDVITMQSNHIMVNPDATTKALWQDSPLGQVFNQFRTFSINASSKVAGHALANAAQGFKRGDYAEMIKYGNKMFWAANIGMLSVLLRDNIRSLGDGEGINTRVFDDGAAVAIGVGLSRSSMIFQMDTLIDTIGGTFGADPFFANSSSIGRSKNWLNLATTPMGQAGSNLATGSVNFLKGDIKKGGLKILKGTPLYRQVGLQQLFNFIQKED